MIYASAIAESIVAPTLFRPAFLHSLGQFQTFARVTSHVSSEERGKAALDALFGHEAVPSRICLRKTLRLWVGQVHEALMSPSGRGCVKTRVGRASAQQ